MLTAYFDESMDNGDGYVVVAGFMGKRSAWKKCMKAWNVTLKKHGREYLHLKELRFLRDRHKDMLRDFGEIPSRAGLRIIFASVNVGAYKPAIAGTVMEVGSAGYIYAYQIAILSALRCVPEGQRLEVICEHQEEFNARRDAVSFTCTLLPECKNKNGKPKLAKWSSIPKSTIIEPSDYAAFALLHRLRDPKSKKAQLCSPILNNPLRRGISMTAQQSLAIITDIMREDPTFQDAVIAPENKRAFISQLPKGEDFQRQMREFIATKTKK